MFTFQLAFLMKHIPVAHGLPKGLAIVDIQQTTTPATPIASATVTTKIMYFLTIMDGAIAMFNHKVLHGKKRLHAIII
jgi:hypothetical protein